MTMIEDRDIALALARVAEQASARPAPVDRLPRVHALARRRRRVRATGSAAVIAVLVGVAWAAAPRTEHTSSPVVPAGPAEREAVEVSMDVTWNAARKEATVKVHLDGRVHEYVDPRSFAPLTEASVLPQEVLVDWGDFGESLGGSQAAGCSTDTPLRPVQQVDAERTHRFEHPGTYVAQVSVYLCSQVQPIRAERVITVR